MCIASMGQKKKQVEPVKEISQNSQGGPIANDSKRIDNLENKLDKILDSMAAIEDRVKKQEGRGARAISPVPSAHSSLRRLDDSEARLPTFEELKSDDRIQGKIQRKLHQYDNMARQDKGKSTDVFKSGRFRLGVHKVHKVKHMFALAINNLVMMTYQYCNGRKVLYRVLLRSLVVLLEIPC